MIKAALEEDIIQALKDCGCSKEKIACFIDHMERHEIAQGIVLLKEHRRTLLDHVHVEERKISCLDYLMYKMKEAMDRR